MPPPEVYRYIFGKYVIYLYPTKHDNKRTTVKTKGKKKSNLQNLKKDLQFKLCNSREQIQAETRRDNMKRKHAM